jgi:hypothetical protein
MVSVQANGLESRACVRGQTQVKIGEVQMPKRVADCFGAMPDRGTILVDSDICACECNCASSITEMRKMCPEF